MILENTFLSLPRLIPTALPLLSPFSFLCHQKWDSASKLPLLPPDLPILMLAGAMDEVVPNEHMRELERLLRKPSGKPERPGKYVEFASGKHSELQFAAMLLERLIPPLRRRYLHSIWLLACCGGLRS